MTDFAYKTLPSGTPLPVHIAIIMDGNGRWATAQGLARTEGHKAGVEAAREAVENCLDYGISYLTLYTFSQENWKRPKAEVEFLFGLLVSFITRELPLLEKRGVRLHLVGRVHELPFAVRKALDHAVKRTATNTAMTLNLALNYSGRQEIVDACKAYFAAHKSLEGLTPENLPEFLYTGGQPDPDLLIRTSGELRLSNFLPYQTTYSELYFSDVLWPDFSRRHLYEAIMHFGQRNRRFGGIEAQ